MSKVLIVRFTKSWRGYSPGELAGFNTVQVHNLVVGGVAAAYSPVTTTAATPRAQAKRADRKADAKFASAKPTAVAPVLLAAVVDGLGAAHPVNNGTDASNPAGEGSDFPGDDLGDTSADAAHGDKEDDDEGKP